MVDSTSGYGEDVTLGGTSYYFGTTNSANYVQVTNATAGTYPTGNYVVATGMTGSTQMLTVQGANQWYGSFSGFEIVSTRSVMANAVTLSADSTINVTGLSNVTVTGLLTIGSNRLSVTGGGSGANTAYSLSLGSNGGVLLMGNPTFDVADNGSGAGTLVLGALRDGGVTHTITKSDAGALTLGAAAIAMNGNDVVNVTGGTLNSNNATALGTLTVVNVAAGATFSLGASQTLGALGDCGTVVLNGASVQLNGNALTVGSGNNLSSTFSGVIADGTGGAGSLIKAGTGTFTLSGSNTYTAGTTISAGTLALGSSLALQQSTLDISGSGALSFGSLTAATLGGLTGPGTFSLLNSLSAGVALQVGGNGSSTTFSGVLNGAGSLTKVGGGELLLGGSSTYTGGTAVNAGTLQTASPAALPGYALASAVSVANRATLAVNVGGPSDWPSSSVDGLLGAASFASGANLGLDTTNGNFSYATSITGGLGLVKLGSNTLALAGANGYTGGTTLAAGILCLANSAALPGGGNITFGGGTLQYSQSNCQDYSADIVASTRPISIDTNGVNVTFASTLASSSGGLTKIGSGTLVLAASNNYGGNSLISGGTLALANPGALQQSTLDTTGSGLLSFGSLTVATLGGLTGPGTLGLSNTASAAVALSIGNNNSSTTFAGALNGTGSLTKVGDGGILLSGSNAYSGGTAVDAGTLEAAGTAALPSYATAGKVAVASGATLAVSAGSSGWTAAGISTLLSSNGSGFASGSIFAIDTSGGSLSCNSNIVGSMGLAMLGGNTLVLTGSNTYAGPTVVTAGTLQVGGGGNSGTLGPGNVSNSGALVFSRSDAGLTVRGAINGSGGLFQNGSGMVTLSGNNSYTGPTTISGGTLQIGNGTTDGSIAGSSGINDNATLAFNLVGSQSYGNVISGTGALYKTGGGTLTLTGSNTFSGPTNINRGSLVGNSASLPGAISLANNANVSFSQSASGTFSNVISGNGSLTAQGPGALTLAVSNTYTGGTTIAGGTVKVANKFALGSGAVTLAGGTLSLAGVLSIGIQFVGNGTPVTGCAGVVPMSNWNNLSGSSFTSTALNGYSGAATTATLSTSGAYGTFSSGSSNQLLNGGIWAGNSQLTATISGIPYVNYSLYAYTSMMGNCENVTFGGTIYYCETTNSASYIQVTNTTAGIYPTGNYLVATGLTGGTQTVDCPGREPIGRFFLRLRDRQYGAGLAELGDGQRGDALCRFDDRRDRAVQRRRHGPVDDRRQPVERYWRWRCAEHGLQPELGHERRRFAHRQPDLRRGQQRKRRGHAGPRCAQRRGRGSHHHQERFGRVDPERGGDGHECQRYRERHRRHAQFQQRQGPGHPDGRQRGRRRHVLARRQPDRGRPGRLRNRRP